MKQCVCVVWKRSNRRENRVIEDSQQTAPLKNKDLSVSFYLYIATPTGFELPGFPPDS